MTTRHEVEELARQVVEACASAGLTVATGESVTAGGVCAALASVPGASAVLRGGVVAYQVDLKQTLLRVSDRDLDSGIVSEEVAVAMARGAALECGATIGVGTTGVAGPSEHDGTAVGEVVISVCQADRHEVGRFTFGGSRDQIILRAIHASLEMVRSAVGNVRE